MHLWPPIEVQRAAEALDERHRPALPLTACEFRLRPERCFAHLYLEALQVADAARLLDRLCRDTPERREAAMALLKLAGPKSLSVAEVYAAHRNACQPGAKSPAARFGVTREPRLPAGGSRRR